jgi:hypothetical protein
MKKLSLILAGSALLLMMTMPALAAEDLVQTVLDGCKTELETYCKDVTPGDGRILACL